MFTLDDWRYGGGVFCGEIDSTMHPTLFKGDIQIRVLLNNRAVDLLSSCIETFNNGEEVAGMTLIQKMYSF